MIEESISATKNIPREGEQWLKVMMFEPTDCNQFLKDGHRNPKWSKVVPSIWLMDDLKNSLYVIQKKFTYEQIFNIVFQYSIIFLMHFKSTKTTNMVLFLITSLTKMIDKVHAYPHHI